MSLAPLAAASAMRSHAFLIVAPLSRKHGAACTAAALNFGRSFIGSPAPSARCGTLTTIVPRDQPYRRKLFRNAEHWVMIPAVAHPWFVTERAARAER